MVFLLTIGAGVVVGGVVALLAIRWPSTPDPHVSGGTITKEVVRHPGLAGHLRHHFNPKTETGVALIVATAVVGAAAVGIGVLLAMIRTKRGLQSVDVRLARFGAEHATAFSTDFLRHLSELGGTRGVILMALVACAIECRRGQARAVVMFLTLVVAGQFALSNGIKYLVDRARPDFSRLTGFAGTSFPSGHSTAAAATLAAIALLATRWRSPRVKIVRCRARGRNGHDGGRDAGVPRRPLVHRCRGGAPARLGLVRDVLDRLRWSIAHLRSARGRSRSGRRCRPEQRTSRNRRRVAWPSVSEGVHPLPADTSNAGAP